VEIKYSPFVYKQTRDTECEIVLLKACVVKVCHASSGTS